VDTEVARLFEARLERSIEKVEAALARIEAKLETQGVKVELKQEKLDDRIRKIEGKWAMADGVVASVAVAWPILLKKIGFL